MEASASPHADSIPSIESNPSQTSEMSKESRELVESRHDEMTISCLQAQHSPNEVKTQLTEISVNPTPDSSTGRGREKRQESTTGEDVEDLREEMEHIKSRVESVCGVPHKLCLEQDIKDVNIDGNSKVISGLLNVDNKNHRIRQTIAGVTATEGSSGMVGVVENVQLDGFWNQ